MGKSKEEQRNKFRQEGKTSTSDVIPYGVTRVIGGKLKKLSHKQNKKLNKQRHKPPKIFYGLNTTK